MLPYLINGERRFVQAVLTGTVSGRDIALTIDTIYDDPDWHPGFDIIWNCAGVTDLLFGPDDLDNLVALQRARADRGGSGRDIIIVKRILDDAMARVYAAMMKNEARRTHLCASEAKALEILARTTGAEPV